MNALYDPSKPLVAASNSAEYAAHEARWGKRSWKYKQMIAKRFTPTELAAEEWRRRWTELRVTISKGEMSTRQQQINETMIRFINLPNYDEVPDA